MTALSHQEIFKKELKKLGLKSRNKGNYLLITFKMRQMLMKLKKFSKKNIRKRSVEEPWSKSITISWTERLMKGLLKFKINYEISK